MKKASFTLSCWLGYSDVPIPDHLTKSKDIIDYLKENIDDLDKYRNGNMDLTGEPLYQAIIEDENGNESTITLDD